MLETRSTFFYRSHHVWFDEYNYCLSIEDKNAPCYLLLRKYPEIHIHKSDLLNLIPCEIDLTSTPFSNTTIITYEIELPSPGKKFGFNLLDDEYFTIPYITDTILNSPAGHQLPSQAKRNLWIIATNGEEPIKAKGILDEINSHQNPRGETKIEISVCRMKSY